VQHLTESRRHNFPPQLIVNTKDNAKVENVGYIEMRKELENEILRSWWADIKILLMVVFCL
jgi:hypothetical protein